MTESNITFLEALDERAKLYPDRPIFWIPQDVDTDKPASKWTPLPFGQFYAQVVAAKQFYTLHATRLGIAQGSVIGIWLAGDKYTDPIHTLAVSAAGFVPQLFNLFFSYPPVVYELLKKSAAKALVIDSQAQEAPDLSGCPVEVIDIANCIFEATSARLEPRPYSEVKDDIAIIYHTSGSTAGIPKLVPSIHSKITSRQKRYRYSGGVDQVVSRMGNFSHSGSMSQIMGALFKGVSIVMPSSVAFTSEELLNMIQSCHLTALMQHVPLMVPHLQRARGDPEFLSALKSLSSITSTGTAFPPELAAWCESEGLCITNAIGSTDCGVIMASSPPGNPCLFKPIPGLSYKLLPLENTDPNQVGLLEFVIPSDSPDLPHPSLLAPDGNFYTGDLFESAGDGFYLFRGRKDDWIKVGVALSCDTKSIDDAVKQSCKDIVFDCVTVGSGRRCPALLVEPVSGTAKDTIPQIIVERLATFNKSRFLHERLDNPGLILVVERDALPRTGKGNIRRQGAQDLFSNELDEMYKATAPSKP